MSLNRKIIDQLDLLIIIVYTILLTIKDSKLPSFQTLNSIIYIIMLIYVLLNVRKVKSYIKETLNTKKNIEYIIILLGILVLCVYTLINPKNIDLSGSIILTFKILILSLYTIYLKTKYETEFLMNIVFTPIVTLSILSTIYSLNKFTIGDISGIYRNRNDFGNILLISSIFLTQKLQENKSMIKYILLITVSLILILTGSRGSTLSFIITVLLFLISKLIKHKIRFNTYLVYILTTICLALIIILNFNQIKERFVNMTKNDSSVESRMKIMDGCIKLIQNNPYGYGASDDVYLKMKPENLDETLKSDYRKGGCHFTPLDIMLKFGYLGFIFEIAYVLVIAKKFLKIIKEETKEATFWVVLALTLNSLTENFTQTSRLLKLILFISIAI